MEELTQLKEEIRILRSMVEQQKEQIEVLKKETPRKRVRQSAGGGDRIPD